MTKKHSDQFTARKTKVRARLKRFTSRPRLSVFRSHQHIYAQIIDDQKGKTLAAASDQELKLKKTESLKPVKKAYQVGQKLAEKALKKKIKKVYFDRGGYKYHGRVKALAEGARAGGLQF